MIRAKSLSRRLFFGAVAWIAISLTVAGVLISFAFERAVTKSLDERLSSELRAVTASLDLSPEGKPQVSQRAEDIRFLQVYSGWYWQIAVNGKTVARSRSLWDAEIATIDAEDRREQLMIVNATGPRNESLRLASWDIRPETSASIITVAVAISTATISSEVSEFNSLLFLSLGGLGAGLVLAVVLQVTVGLWPLKALTQQLSDLRAGSRSRLGTEYPAEVAPLVKAFEEVRAHDLETVERARTEAANLAHALKTPLAQLVSELSEIKHPATHQAVRIIDGVKRTIEFHIARATRAGMSGAKLHSNLLLPVVRDLVQGLSRVYASKGIQFDVQIGSDICANAEEEDITELVGNLLENAAKWCSARVRIEGRTEGHRLEIRVEDDGPGLSSELATTAMRRGLRLDEGTPGSGLGLSIVADIVAGYNGSMTLDRSPRLGGLAVSVKLPIRTAANPAGS